MRDVEHEIDHVPIQLIRAHMDQELAWCLTDTRLDRCSSCSVSSGSVVVAVAARVVVGDPFDEGAADRWNWVVSTPGGGQWVLLSSQPRQVKSYRHPPHADTLQAPTRHTDVHACATAQVYLGG